MPTCVSSLLGSSWRAGQAKPAVLQPLSESELQWWLLVLSHLVRNGGEAVLPHLTSLTVILELTSEHTEYKVAKCASKLRRRLLQVWRAYPSQSAAPRPPRPSVPHAPLLPTPLCPTIVDVTVHVPHRDALAAASGVALRRDPREANTLLGVAAPAGSCLRPLRWHRALVARPLRGPSVGHSY